MTYRRIGERARLVSRLFVLSLCVSAAFSGAAFAQSAPKASQFRDARLMDVLADDEPIPASTAKNAAVKAPVAKSSKSGVVSAEHRESADPFQGSKIRSVSATTAKKPVKSAKTVASAKAAAARPIAQTQYSAAATEPLTAQRLGAFDASEPFNDVCPDPRDMPSILDVPYKLIDDGGPKPESCPLPDENFRRKAPTPITFTWKASSLCYKPLYFEDVQLERYGHYCNPFLQPFLSRARFLVTIPCLPYLIGVDPPNQCIYDLGYYRPGNCAPSMLQPVPISLRGGLLEAGAVVGAAALIP